MAGSARSIVDPGRNRIRRHVVPLSAVHRQIQLQASTKVSHARSCARTRWNLRFGFVNEDMDLSIIVFGENIFDEQGDVFIGVGNGEPTF